MRTTPKGIVTFPMKIREKPSFFKDAEEKSSKTKGESLIRKMTSEKFIKMTTKEIMALTRGE